MKRFFAFTLIASSLYWIALSQLILLGTSWPQLIKDVIAVYFVSFAFITAYIALLVIMRRRWAEKFILLVSFIGILNIVIAAPFIHREASAEVGIVSADGRFQAIDEKKWPKPSSVAEAAAQGAFLVLAKILTKTGILLVNIVTGIIEIIFIFYLLLLLFIFRPRNN